MMPFSSRPTPSAAVRPTPRPRAHQCPARLTSSCKGTLKRAGPDVWACNRCTRFYDQADINHAARTERELNARIARPLETSAAP
jgi:ribosomal protein L37AE/L43A